MLACVVIGYVAGHWSVKDCVKEEGDSRLSPSSTCRGDCVRDEVDLRYRFHHHYGCVKGCGWFEVVADGEGFAATTS
jgi:hypothetical protein